MKNPKVEVALCRKRLGEAFAAYQARDEKGDARLQADVDAALRQLYDAGLADGVAQGRLDAVDRVKSMIDSIVEDTL